MFFSNFTSYVWYASKKKTVSQVIASKNAIAFRRAAGELNAGCWGKSTLLFQHKCVQQLRGTRRVGTFVGAQCRLCFCLHFCILNYEEGKARARCVVVLLYFLFIFYSSLFYFFIGNRDVLRSCLSKKRTKKGHFLLGISAAQNRP